MDCSERHLFEPFIYTMIILPRQARDKHRESTQKKMRFPHRFATHVIWIVNNIYNDIILYIYIILIVHISEMDCSEQVHMAGGLSDGELGSHVSSKNGVSLC